MRLSRTIVVAAGVVVSFFVSAAPASATSYSLSNHGGDWATYNSTSNMLTVCDRSPGNGTAEALLHVDGGNTWILFDSNGAQGSCATAGPLSVNDSKAGILYLCQNASPGAPACADIQSLVIPRV
jgi:hypothetical protein